MATSRSSKVKNSTVDLGAQYISVTPEYAHKHGSFHDDLLSNNLLQPLKAPIEGNKDRNGTSCHYVTPQGIGSLVKHFLENIDAEVSFEQHINRIDIDNSKIMLTCQNGTSEECDAVILTMPVPQILQLNGSIKDIIDANVDVKQRLQNVTYSSRFCLGLFYNPGTDLNYPWAGKYVYDDPCVRFIAIDNKKRGITRLHLSAEEPMSYSWHECRPQHRHPINADDIGPSVLLHSSVPFAIENLETEKEDIKPVLMQHLKRVLPDLPEPVEVKSHKWRYSQVHHGYSGSPGCVVLCNKPLVILAGDGFSHSNLDGCLDSAIAVKDSFLQLTEKL